MVTNYVKIYLNKKPLFSHLLGYAETRCVKQMDNESQGFDSQFFFKYKRGIVNLHTYLVYHPCYCV